MKILITGGAGYIGSMLCEYLLNEGHEVTVIDTFLYSRNSLNSYYANKKFNVISMDVRDPNIKEHLISDVPVGICLSSGSDSQMILNCIKEENLKKIECFTYGFNEKKYNEIEKLKYLKKDKNQIFNSLILKPFNLINDLEESIRDFECPIGGLGTLGLWKLMKKAKKRNIPVLLSGEGADEAFCGYKYYYYFFLLELYKNKQYDLLNKELN